MPGEREEFQPAAAFAREHRSRLGNFYHSAVLVMYKYRRSSPAPSVSPGGTNLHQAPISWRQVENFLNFHFVKSHSVSRPGPEGKREKTEKIDYLQPWGLEVGVGTGRHRTMDRLCDTTTNLISAKSSFTLCGLWNRIPKQDLL